MACINEKMLFEKLEKVESNFLNSNAKESSSYFIVWFSSKQFKKS